MMQKVQDLEETNIKTPIGNISIIHKNIEVYRVKLSSKNKESVPQKKQIEEEINDYFSERMHYFSFKLNPLGTEIQKKIWRSLLDIPYGHVLTYKELGDKIGFHARVIGMACRTNPIPILIPCHRIVSANKGKDHYSFLNGPETKNWLLNHEQKNMNIS